MSASREKKQRLNSQPVNKAKALAEQEKAAATKRKTITYTIIGVVVAVLAAALLFWDSGIIQRNMTALTINETDHSVAEVTYYYNLIHQETSLYSQYGLNSYNTSASPQSQVYSMDPKTGEIVTYHEFFQDYALEAMTSVTALYDAAVAAGYTEADVKDAVALKIDNATAQAKAYGYSSLKQMLVAFYSNFVTPSLYREIVTRQEVANLYLNDYKAALNYTDSDLDAYYKENADSMDTFEYGYLYFRADTVSKTDKDGKELSKDEIAAAEKEALAAAKEKAEKVELLLKDMDPSERADALADLIEEHDPYNSAEHAVILGPSVLTSISEWIKDPARKAGDVGLVPYQETGFYVPVFFTRYLLETESVSVRHILVNAEMDEGAEKPTEQQMDAAKAKAEQILADWKAGEATEESFAALVKDHSDDTGSNTSGGLYSQVFPNNFVDCLDQWLFQDGARKPGDTAILKNDGQSNYYGYHIAYFVGVNEGDIEWRNTADSALRSEAGNAHRDELMETVTVTEQSGMRFTP